MLLPALCSYRSRYSHSPPLNATRPRIPPSPLPLLLLLSALAYSLLKRQQQLETLQAEVQGEKEPELLLETTSALLSRMKDKLSKAAAATAAEPGAAANGAPQDGLGDAATGGPVAEAASAPAPLPATPENSIARAFMVADQAKPAAAAAVGAAA